MFAVSDLARYEMRGFSQNGEDGVLVEIFNRIGVTNRFFVEFGIQAGTEGDCVLLADVFGWSGVFIEADEVLFAALSAKYEGFPVRCVRDMVTAERIEEIFTSAEVPAAPDLLSIDIDGNDALRLGRPGRVPAAGARDRVQLRHPLDRAGGAAARSRAGLGRQRGVRQQRARPSTGWRRARLPPRAHGT